MYECKYCGSKVYCGCLADVKPGSNIHKAIIAFAEVIGGN